MVDQTAFTECLLDLAIQRTLVGFEQGIKRAMSCFSLNAWACILPPSFDAAGRPLFVAHGIQTNSRMLIQASTKGFESLEIEGEKAAPNLEVFARELAPSRACRWRILRMTRERRMELTLFCYRPSEAEDFSTRDLELLQQFARHIDRCFLLLAEQQEQEFMVGLFRLVNNLHPEGICVLDHVNRVLFENRSFREHMLIWNHGRAALKNLTLPKQTTLPPVWQEACSKALVAFQQLSFPPASTRMALTQGPLSTLQLALSDAERLDGTVRFIAFQSSMGSRPYLLLTSVIAQNQAATGLTLTRLADDFSFSRRERQLAELVLEGASAREISKKLSISLPTVKTHIRNILRKAGVKTRLQLIGLCYSPR